MAEEQGVTYEVEYLCYEYNCGQGGRGYNRRRREFKLLDEARAFAGKIEDSAANRLPEEEDAEFRDDVLYYDGHFIAGDTRILKVMRYLVA